MGKKADEFLRIKTSIPAFRKPKLLAEGGNIFQLINLKIRQPYVPTPILCADRLRIGTPKRARRTN